MGPYDMEAYWYEFTGIVTNATPTDAYRGAGRPEATYVARARRRRARPKDRQGSGGGASHRSFVPQFHEATDGDQRSQRRQRRTTSRLLDKALELADYDELRKEQQAGASAAT